MLYVSYFHIILYHKYFDINFTKYTLNNNYTQGIHKVDYYLNCHEKKCLNKDTKMSYNYITLTHVGSHLICSIEMKDIVS